MTKDEIKHINWIYNRLTSVHKENPNFEYMKRFKEIIDKELTLCDVVGQSEQLCEGLHSTDFNGKCFKCGEQVFVREPK